MIKVIIDDILKQKGKTRYWLAKQCNISQNNMAKICNNETNSIKFDTMEKICKVLECSPNDIIVSDDPQMQRLFAYAYMLQNKGGTSE